MSASPVHVCVLVCVGVRVCVCVSVFDCVHCVRVCVLHACEETNAVMCDWSPVEHDSDLAIVPAESECEGDPESQGEPDAALVPAETESEGDPEFTGEPDAVTDGGLDGLDCGDLDEVTDELWEDWMDGTQLESPIKDMDALFCEVMSAGPNMF